MTNDLQQRMRGLRIDPPAPVDVDGLVDAGLRRRRHRHTLLAAGTTLAIAALLLVTLPTLDDELRPPVVVDQPTGEPTVPTPEPTAAQGDAPEVSAELPGLTPHDLDEVDVMVLVDGSETDGEVVVFRSDGTTYRLPIDTPPDSSAEILPDGAGGFVWQPTGGAGGSPPVLAVSAEGETTSIIPSTTDMSETYALVGRGEGEVLVERVTRDLRGPEEPSSIDLLAYPVPSGDPRVVAEELATDSSGILAAAALEVAVYAQAFEETHEVAIAWPRGEPFVAHVGDALAGRPIHGIAMGQPDEAFVLEGAESAQLLRMNAVDGEVSRSWQVPAAIAPDDVVSASLSGYWKYLVVNRQTSDGWLAPLLFDTTNETWHVLDVDGRALLAAPTIEPPPAPACAEHEERRNAPPSANPTLDVYLACQHGVDQWEAVYRYDAGLERTGDVSADAEAVLDLVLDGAPAELEDQGYLGLWRRTSGDQPLDVRSVEFDGSTLIVDFDFPEWGTPSGGSSATILWHNLLVANLLQFEQVDRIELRANGACDYGRYFEMEPGCGVFDRSDVLWR